MTPAPATVATTAEAASGPAPRWTLITGASSGIGAAFARLCAARGEALVLTARRRDRLDALAEELNGAQDGRSGVPVAVIPADLADPRAPEALMAEVAARGITLHTLINNAGFGLRGSFAELPLERQMENVQVNVAAVTALSRLALPGLLARRAGGILNVASVASFTPGPGMAVYHAGKAYLLSLSEALAEEARERGVTISALCPGPTRSEFGLIAGERTSLVYRLSLAEAETVARIGLDRHRRGEVVIVPGLLNAAAPLAARLLPRALTRRLARSFQS